MGHLSYSGGGTIEKEDSLAGTLGFFVGWDSSSDFCYAVVNMLDSIEKC
jgi:hypothetical protein